jgi:hypothetical protein
MLRPGDLIGVAVEVSTAIGCAGRLWLQGSRAGVRVRGGDG